MNLKPGVIIQVDGLEPPTDAVTRILRLGNWFMKPDSQSMSRHYRIVLQPTPDGQDWVVVEALADGTVRRKLSEYADEPHSFWWITGATDTQGQQAAQVADTMLGRPYDYGFYFHCALQVLWHWLLHGFKPHSVDALEICDDKNRLEVCTEVVDSCDFVSGMPDWDRGAAPTPMAFQKAIGQGWVLPA